MRSLFVTSCFRFIFIFLVYHILSKTLVLIINTADFIYARWRIKVYLDCFVVCILITNRREINALGILRTYCLNYYFENACYHLRDIKFTVNS